jgi:hypothetical protein
LGKAGAGLFSLRFKSPCLFEGGQGLNALFFYAGRAGILGCLLMSSLLLRARARALWLIGLAKKQRLMPG